MDTSTQPKQTRGALLCAAGKRFAEQGFERARLSDIAGDAGVTTGAFYWHFTSKEDLLRTLFLEYDGELTRALAEADDLQQACRGWLDVAVTHPAAARTSVELTRAGSDFASERQRVREGWIALVVRLLPPEVDPRLARVCAQLLVDVLDYYAFTQVMGWTSQEDLDEVGRTVAHLVQNGLYRR